MTPDSADLAALIEFLDPRPYERIEARARLEKLGLITRDTSTSHKLTPRGLAALERATQAIRTK